MACSSFAGVGEILASRELDHAVPCQCAERSRCRRHHRRDRETSLVQGCRFVEGGHPDVTIKDLLGNVLDRAVVAALAEAKVAIPEEDARQFRPPSAGGGVFISMAVGGRRLSAAPYAKRLSFDMQRAESVKYWLSGISC
jgi:hypothetical protein